MADQQGNVPAPSQEQQQTEQQAQAPAAPQQTPSGPWAESLARAFPDEDVRQQVDAYLRQEIQPHVTRVEQDSAQARQVWDNLWDEQNTLPTYLSLAEAIYGPELAQVVADAFTAHFEKQGMSPEDAQAAGEQAAAQQAQADQEGNTDIPSYEDWLAQQPPEVQEFFEQRDAAAEDAEYDALLDQIGSETEPMVKGREALFSRYVAAEDGDIDRALEVFRADFGPVLKEHPELFLDAAPQASAEQQQQAEAPTVLGNSSTPGSTTPPQVPEHQSMEDALHDFMVDLGHGNSSGRL